MQVWCWPEIPADPRVAEPWPQRTIYTWESETEHEGLAKGDIDLDGIVDIIGGGRWFKFDPADGSFSANVIDQSQAKGRVAVGQLREGGRPEVVFVIGDGAGPLKWYEWTGTQWVGTDLLGYEVDHGHTLQIGDINGDSYLDILVAEMRISIYKDDAKSWVFYGDGTGSFRKTELSTGIGNHNGVLSDLDDDGDLDVLGKPYDWDTPRLDLWINEGQRLFDDPWESHVLDNAMPWRSIFVDAADLNGDGLPDVVSGAWWYENPASVSGIWTRHLIGAPLNNMAALHDFDGDGDIDILGRKVSAQSPARRLSGPVMMVWGCSPSTATLRRRSEPIFRV